MNGNSGALRHELSSAPRMSPADVPLVDVPLTGRGVTAAMLRTLPIFAQTSEQALAMIAQAAMPRRVARGSFVVLSGEPTDFVYFVLSGSLNVQVSDEDGREAILSILGPGAMFGEMGILDDEVRSASVLAVTPCVLVALTKFDFKRCLQENFDVAFYVMRKLAQRLRSADRRIESLALLDVGGRVARLLRDISRAERDESALTRRISKQEIAKMVGASREMVSRVLKDMQARGLIDAEDGGRIVLREAGGP